MDLCACWFDDSTFLKEALSLTPTYLRGTGNMFDYKDWQIPLGRCGALLVALPRSRSERAVLLCLLASAKTYVLYLLQCRFLACHQIHRVLGHVLCFCCGVFVLLLQPTMWMCCADGSSNSLTSCSLLRADQLCAVLCCAVQALSCAEAVVHSAHVWC
jgi:hypothetical protein